MEAVVTLLILSLSIVALMPIFGMSYKGDKRSEKILVASYLAKELMEEIKLRKWDEASYVRPGPVPTPSPIGTDLEENRADKRTFNDVDDFDGWAEDPPLDPVMRPLDEFRGFRRTVSVEYQNPDGTSSVNPTNYKHVKVCVSSEQSVSTCLERIFANY
jgi:hypothetical protein